MALAALVPGCAGGSARSVAPHYALAASLPRALPPAGESATHHVAPGGSDDAPGTRSRPWRTLGHALAVARPGDVVEVAAGVYRESLLVTARGTAGAPITLRAAADRAVVLRPARGRGEDYPLRIGEGASDLRVQGFVIEGATGPSSANVYIFGGSHDVEISDCEVRDSERQGIFVDRSTSGVSILRCSIHDNGRPENAQQDHGIYMEGRDQLIASCVIYDQRHGYGIQVFPSADGVTIVGNTIVGNLLGGIVVGGDSTRAAERTTIANNVIVGNGSGISTYWEGRVGEGNVARANLAFANLDEDFADAGHGIRYTGNVVADPGFVDRSGRDFRLRSDSPGLSRAISELSHPFDVTGAPRPDGELPDLGAFERPPAPPGAP